MVTLGLDRTVIICHYIQQNHHFQEEEDEEEEEEERRRVNIELLSLYATRLKIHNVLSFNADDNLLNLPWQKIN